MSASKNSDTCRSPALARTGTTSPYGKFDDWIRPTRIESPIKQRFESKVAAAFAEAGMAGKPPSEAVRDIVRVIALGPDTAKRMYGEGVLVVLKTITAMSNKTQ